MFKPSKIQSAMKLTFTKTDLQNGVLEELHKQGFVVKSKVWNKENTKLEITALKVMDGKKGDKKA